MGKFQQSQTDRLRRGVWRVRELHSNIDPIDVFMENINFPDFSHGSILSSMKRIVASLTWAFLLPLVFNSCSPKSWTMDYGKPAAQFHEHGVLRMGKAFVGKKVTVKGVVERVDTSDPESAWIILSHGTRCNFGKFKAMAESYSVGQEVYVDGFLKRCDEGDVLIDPAMGRDPKAPFDPIK